MPTLKERKELRLLQDKQFQVLGADAESQTLAIRKLLDEAKSKDNPVVTIGTNGKLIKNSLFLSEIERSAIEIVAVWCADTKRDLSKFAFNVQYHHNSTQVTLTDEFTVLDICHGVQITASIVNYGDMNARTLLDIIIGDEVFNVADGVREVILLHAITEALYAVTMLEDDETDTKSFKAIASSNKKHSKELRSHFERWFKEFTEHDEDSPVRAGNDNTMNRPRVMTGKSVAMWERIGLKHDVFNIIDRPFREPPTDDANPDPKVELIPMHCANCDPKMKWVNSIHPKNVKHTMCGKIRKLKGEKVACNVNLTAVTVTVEANKAKDKD